MSEETSAYKLNISVRELVEFILREGDIDNRSSHADPDAMQEGSRLHRKIQKKQDSDYRAEVALNIEYPIEYENEKILFCIDGRADGIFPKDKDGQTIFFIDEIKTTYADVRDFTEPVKVHLAQAKVYAFIYANQNDFEQIGVQMTYCNIDTEIIQRFEEAYNYEELSQWFFDLTNAYAKWIVWKIKWERVRDASIKSTEFPFSYREGQRDLVAGVYRTILREKKLFLEAPTGVGKTISTVFPSVKAFAEGKVCKIFYGTAKTIARTVAEEAFKLLQDKGVRMKNVTITAKEKVCVLEKPECNPVKCVRAKGHFDRVNDAVYDMLENESHISRELIAQYAEKHNVCPFEMCLDVTTWADAVICDYNYIFDPNVYLRRFFADGPKRDYCFLIDEAHNLVERAREMYSAVLVKEDFLSVKKMVGNSDPLHTKLSGALEKCNRAMLTIKRQCEDFAVWEEVGVLVHSLMQFMSVYESMPRHFSVEDPELMSTLYLNVRHFMNMHDQMDEDYTIYSDYRGSDFCVHLQCMDPSRSLKRCLEKGRSAVFFSATLLPIKYYISQLGGALGEDYAVYAPSPFSKENRLIMVGTDVSTKYTRRSREEYERIAKYISDFTSAKKGNYMAFFPSYQMMNEIAEILDINDGSLLVQKPSMTEQEKEEFLAFFEENSATVRIGFCVMGGIFGEGIDLRADRLIGAVIVGTGLPQVCNERELFRNYYDEKNGNGFDYAYLYSGMNKVLQSAGRVIRTAEDRGAILLLDERFRQPSYRNLFPQEWNPYVYVTANNMKQELNRFWNGDLHE